MIQFVESIKHYIKSSSHNALLLTGEWGCGKTYFVKNTLLKELLEDGIDCLYVSLNGVKSTNEIVRQIIATKLKLSQNVIIGSSFLKSILDIGSLIPGMDKLKDISISSNENIIKLFDFSKNFIVFDDLERLSSEFNLSDFFGFINTEFVEHNGYKILFIANESEIDDKKYPLIKEKIIGFTYKYDGDIISIYESYISKQEDNISWFYTEYKNLILELIHKYQIKNLRTIFSSFNSFNYIIKNLSKEIIAHHHFPLIVFVLSITNEIKLGKITIEDNGDNKGLKNLTNTVTTKQLLASIIERNKNATSETKVEEKVESYEEYFAKAYLDNNPNKYIFYNCIFKLLLTGYVPTKEILEEIILKPTLPKWKEAEDIMIRYMEYDEEKVKNNVSLVLKFAENGDYPPLSYGYFYHWLSMFSQNKVIQVRNDSLIKKLKKGFSISANKNGLNYKSIDREYYSVANTPDNPLSIHINKRIGLLREKEEKNRYNEIFRILDDDNKLYDYFERNQHTCIFDKINIDKLSKALKSSLSSSIFHFTQNINHRYNFKNIYDYYIPEIDGISRLIDRLNKHRISKDKFPVKIIAINHLREDLESIRKRLRQ